ncbi:DNA primase family protein [Mycobacteroides abscessus]|uniref:DNA primase family protein n=1 Tax=Mycobacteroides abscessus TaxID=36809 RepID=UPI000C2613FF|nr:phage/plasmid primase, P4 family [Mycobacteroides abscessus]
MPKDDDDEQQFVKELAEDDRMGHAYWGARLATGEEQLRYSGKKWYAWNGTYWEVSDGDAMKAAHRMMVEALANREQIPNPTDGFLKSVVSQAAPYLAFDPARWDAARHLINLKSGIYNFKRCKHVEHHPGANMTKAAPGGYYPNDEFRDWEAFLDGMPTMRDVETRRYVQKLFGLALNGEHHREIFPILHGPGNTGRSRLVDALHTAAGEYAHSGASTLLKKLPNERHTAEVFALKDKRVVPVHELDRQVRYDSGKLKMLTGGDRVNARGMYQNDGDFLPTHTFLLLTNNYPWLPSGDSALERRVRVIPFEALETVDEGYSELVRTPEFADAVITWAIRGWELYVEDGLDEPGAVLDATKKMWRSTNYVARFIDEACDRVTRLVDASTTRELFLAFEDWKREQGITQHVGERDFGRELDRLDHPTQGNRRARVGLRAPDPTCEND